MLIIREDRGSYEIGIAKNVNNDLANKYNQVNGAQFFNDSITSNLNNLCNDMIETFRKHEQMNDAKISKINESMLNKTINAFHETEQMNDDKIKHMIESFSDNNVEEEKFECIESQMYDMSMIHQNMQMDFLKNKKASLEA